MSSETLDLLITTLVLAASIGLSLYAALLVPSLVAALAPAALPASLAGLAAPHIWGTLIALLVIEWLTGRDRLADLSWHALHTLVKPLAAALLASLALTGLERPGQWAAALVASGLALALHMPALAARVAARTAGPYARRGLITSTQTGLALALAALAISAPPFAAGAAAIALFAPLPWLPRIWGAARLFLAAAFDALSRAGRPRAWEADERLPRPLRRAVEAELGSSLAGLKTTPVTLARLGFEHPYWRGRLLVLPGRPPLFARRRLRPHLLRLSQGDPASDRGLLVETVEVESARAEESYALCLGPETAPLAAILAVLASAPPLEPASGTSRELRG